jgi:hypothetical protein
MVRAFQRGAFQLGAFQDGLAVLTSELADYFFLFPSQGAAADDLVVGPQMFSGRANLDVLLWPDLRKLSAVPAPGYRLMVSSRGPLNAVYFGHPNIELVVNRTRQLAGRPCVLFSVYPDLSNVSIVANNSGAVYTQRGLAQ